VLKSILSSSLNQSERLSNRAKIHPNLKITKYKTKKTLDIFLKKKKKKKKRGKRKIRFETHQLLETPETSPSHK